MLITVDVPDVIKQRKESLGATWGLIVLRGVQALEGKEEQALKDLQQDSAKMQEKVRQIVLKNWELEGKITKLEQGGEK